MGLTDAELYSNLEQPELLAYSVEPRPSWRGKFVG